MNRGLAHLFLSLGFFWRPASSKTAIYRSRQYFVMVSKLPLTYLRPPSSAEAASESPPTVSGVQHQMVVQREWAVFSFCLDVGTVWDIVWGWFPVRWWRKCFDSSVLICLTSAVFSKVLMIWERDTFVFLQTSASRQLTDVSCYDCFSVFVKKSYKPNKTATIE